MEVLTKKVALLEHVDSAPSVGAGCASQCQSALAADSVHLCPKWCTGISSKPSLGLSVFEGPNDDGNLGNGAACIFSRIFEKIGDNIGTISAEHSALLGFRMPIVKKATKVRASLRIGVDGVVDSTDKAHLRIASVDEKSLTPLFRDLSLTAAPFTVACHETGHVVGEVLSKGLNFRVSDLVTTDTNGALLDLDMSAQVQHLVDGKQWQFNNMLLVLITMEDGNGDPPASGGDGPFLSVLPSEIVIKFMRPAAPKNSYSQGYGPGYEQPAYGYDNYSPSQGHGYNTYSYGQNYYDSSAASYYDDGHYGYLG
ncbi:MAG: hypothetical protein MHM6MM_004630 [Cercozoa sp. M6MM]